MSAPAPGAEARRGAVFADPEELDTSLAAPILEGAGLQMTVLNTTDHSVITGASDEAVALLVSCTRVDASLLQALPHLRIVSAMSVGIDTIDLEAARERGVWVTNVPAAATDEVAVHALALALSLLRHLPAFHQQVRYGGWSGEAVGPLRRPGTLTAGIVGMGRIGRRFAEMARVVFGRVLAYDVAGARGWPEGVESTPLEELLSSADVVSLHAPAQPGDVPLLDAERFGTMKHGTVLVNVARGSLVDEAALLEALDSRRLAGAGLDVLADEPPPSGHPLLAHPKVILTPHVAYLSRESAREYVVRAAENVATWARTGRPLDVVVEGNS